MRILVKFGFKLLAVLGLGSFASLAAAGSPSPGAIIIYGPVGSAAAIPTISGSLLIALAVLLMLVAFRLLKDRPHAGTKLVIAVAAIAALATGAGGIKLVADAHAVVLELNMQDDDGGTLFVQGNGSSYKVFNRTSVTQEIKNIENNCLIANGGDNGGGNGGFNGGEVQPTVQALNGGQSVGACSVGTTLAPDTQYCDISINCNSI